MEWGGKVDGDGVEGSGRGVVERSWWVPCRSESVDGRTDRGGSKHVWYPIGGDDGRRAQFAAGDLERDRSRWSGRPSMSRLPSAGASMAVVGLSIVFVARWELLTAGPYWKGKYEPMTISVASLSSAKLGVNCSRTRQHVAASTPIRQIGLHRRLPGRDRCAVPTGLYGPL